MPPSQGRPGLPAGFDRLVARALAKDPDGRPSNASELAAELGSLGSAAVPDDASATETYVSLAPQPRRPRLAKRAAAVAATLCLALAAAWGARHYSARSAVDSLAILPFESRSADSDIENLGDGLAESLIDQLSRLRRLRVMARATVFRHKGASDALEAGRKIGVAAVLAGSIGRRDGRLLISAELVQTSSGQRLWGESYDRPAADLMLVQDSIAANVADRLRLPLSTEEKLALRRHGTDNPSAYELFLKARPWLALDTEEGDLEARRLFQQAAAADSRFTAPHVGIAIIHSRAAVNGYEPPAEAWARVDEAVAKALELEPGDLSAICQQINRRFYSEWDFASIEQEYQRVRQDPKLARGRLFEPTFAIVLFSWARGDAEDAVALLERALEDDPASIETRTMMADLLVQAGRLDAAIAQYRTLVAEDPGEARAWFGLAGALRRRGELSAAIDALRKAFELSGETEGAEALVSARTDDDYERAEVAVARSRLADLQTLAQERYVSPLNIARLHAQVGDRESAFATLEAAFAERSPGLVFLKVDGAWDRIRDDPRFAALVRRVGIP